MTHKTVLRVAALVSGISGVIILAGVLYPIISYSTTYSPRYSNLLSPVSDKKPANVEEVDYTRASNWFVGGVNNNDFVSKSVEYYTISIPRLKIENASVAIGGEDLSEHIIQYPRTALPGKRGNAALFGHSILPIFYDPKNYLSIF